MVEYSLDRCYRCKALSRKKDMFIFKIQRRRWRFFWKTLKITPVTRIESNPFFDAKGWCRIELKKFNKEDGSSQVF